MIEGVAGSCWAIAIVLLPKQYIDVHEVVIVLGFCS